MFVEDLLSLLTLDSNDFLSTTPGAWNTSRHTDTKIDEYYDRYARELNSVKRRAIAKELQEYMADKLYWNTVSGSPFYQVAQPWMKGYTFNAEFEVHYETVWLDKYGARGVQMRDYIIKRMLQMIPTVLMVTLVVFAMMQAIPGDPIVALLGDAYDEEIAAKLRQSYGLDKPVVVQYVIWLGKLLRGTGAHRSSAGARSSRMC